MTLKYFSCFSQELREGEKALFKEFFYQGGIEGVGKNHTYFHWMW